MTTAALSRQGIKACFINTEAACFAEACMPGCTGGRCCSGFFLQLHCAQPSQSGAAGYLRGKTREDDCKPATTVQQVQQRPMIPSLDEPDLIARRYHLARDIRSMRHRQLLTDTAVVLEGYTQKWQVHGLVLATASSVFTYILEDTQQTGKPKVVPVSPLWHVVSAVLCSQAAMSCSFCVSLSLA